MYISTTIQKQNMIVLFFLPIVISPCVKTPIDIDECALGLAGCDVNANCSNTEGSYECTCSLGYTGSGMDCSGRWLF